MQLRQEQKQTQKLLPQTITALEILQLGICQLQSYIATAVLENPVLESDDPPMLSFFEEGPDFEVSEPTFAPHAPTEQFSQSQVSGDIPDNRTVAYGDDLTTHLLFQLEALHLPPILHRYATMVIHSLDENGYLRQDLPDTTSPMQRELFSQAIDIVQSLEPAGVCARNLSECLRLQLKAQGETGLAYRITADYLTQIGNHRFGSVAANLQVSEAQVRIAFAQIQELSPYPCAAFHTSHNTCYVIPDVLVKESDCGLSVELNNCYVPTLKISPFYSKLGRETQDTALRQYITQKTSNAQWLINCVAQRENTILRCSEEILKRQVQFFAGAAPLTPMAMQDIALAVGIHVSTVSRALNGKYIQTPKGTLKINDLFSAKLGRSGNVSAAMAQEALVACIQSESKREPLSDMRLSELLTAQGLPLSRRTVAKYRELLEIPSAMQRKKD